MKGWMCGKLWNLKAFLMLLGSLSCNSSNYNNLLLCKKIKGLLWIKGRKISNNNNFSSSSSSSNRKKTKQTIIREEKIKNLKI
jgi:hypothetical protein